MWHLVKYRTQPRQGARRSHKASLQIFQNFEDPYLGKDVAPEIVRGRTWAAGVFTGRPAPCPSRRSSHRQAVAPVSGGSSSLSRRRCGVCVHLRELCLGGEGAERDAARGACPGGPRPGGGGAAPPLGPQRAAAPGLRAGALLPAHRDQVRWVGRDLDAKARACTHTESVNPAPLPGRGARQST